MLSTALFQSALFSSPPRENGPLPLTNASLSRLGILGCLPRAHFALLQWRPVLSLDPMRSNRLSKGVQMHTAAAQNQQGMDPSTQQTPTAVQTVPPSVNREPLKILITKLVDDVTSAFEKGSKKTKDEEPAAKEIQMMKIKMEDLREDWSSEGDSLDKEQALELLKKGLGICTEAETLMKQLIRPPEGMKEITKQASNLKIDVRNFCTKAQSKAGNNPFYTKPPRQARKMASSANSSPSSAAESAVESARFKIAEATGLLERQENRYDETCKELKESNKELSKALQSLAEFCPEKIADFDQIRETLIKGIKALASVREQWQKLVEFFQFISNIIKVCQKESLSSFIEYAKVGQERVLAIGYSSTDFMRDVIYEQVSQANSASYVVWSIANTYVEISRNHLMSRVASLGLSWPLEAGQFEQQYLQYLSAFQQIASQRGPIHLA